MSQTSILQSLLMSLHGLLVTYEMIFEVYNSESKTKYHASLQHSRAGVGMIEGECTLKYHIVPVSFAGEFLSGFFCSIFAAIAHGSSTE